jgi:cell wall-associated NlpC family hydrolase
MASSFPVIEPRPVAMKEAMAAVSPLGLDLDPIRYAEAVPVNGLDLDGSARAAFPTIVSRTARADLGGEPFAPSIVTGVTGNGNSNEENSLPEPDAWFEPAAEPAVLESGWRATVLRNAFSFLGTHYVWGGENPGGFDCSGYVQYVMARSGIKLPRTAREMRTAVQEIPASELRPGDLIFFRSPDHVGIYVGDGRFVHASSGRRRVAIESLGREFYQRRYIGSGRVAEWDQTPTS